MDEEEDLLGCLLAVATEEVEKIENNQEDKQVVKDTQNGNLGNSAFKNAKILREADIFQHETNLNRNPNQSTSDPNSLIHNGDTDSSDDEGNKNYENQKYNEYGKQIKTMLISSDPPISSHYGVPKQRVAKSTWKHNPNKSSGNGVPSVKTINQPEKKIQDVFMDPIFGMRIVNPLVSSAMLIDKMEGRLAVKFADLTKQMFAGNLKEKDWVICGVVVAKSPPKTSQKGTQFSIWTLSDLKEDVKTIGLFMFGSAHADLWKTVIGTVIGVLNPNILDRKEGSKDVASLSVDSAQKVMVFGQSKDYGICKSVRKSGERCTSIVNLSTCEFCIYHIKQEYQKCSKRSELQANFSGKGMVNLRNKVLGKNEVFYAGKSYTAIPAKKSKKLETRDQNILQNLKGINTDVKPKNVTKKPKGAARKLDVNPAQRARDLELLKKLGGTDNLESKVNFSGNRSDEISLHESRATALNVISKLKAQKNTETLSEKNKQQYDLKGDLFVGIDDKSSFSGQTSKEVSIKESKSVALGVISKLKTANQLNNNSVTSEPKGASSNDPSGLDSPKAPHFGSPLLKGVSTSFPTLSGPGKGGLIDLTSTVTPRRADRAKISALKFIQANGPIRKEDPNSTKGSANKKRKVEAVLEQEISAKSDDTPAKKSKLAESEFISDRFRKMMAMTSKHADLLEQHDDDEKEKYFKKLEAKEKMEEKMTNTHKVKCKAVKCLQCKYTSFSASELCKSERHPLKVFDAMKRFYKCSNCQNRTVTLELIPTRPCTNCGSSKWEKTGMMKEKVALVQHSLSIRGVEQKFVNSVVMDANLDLLVPDE